MRKLLLTSAGFENPRLAERFLSEIVKPAGDIRVLFVPTAAVFDDARAMLPKCYQDLINAGIAQKNIVFYDLKYLLPQGQPCADGCPMALRLPSPEELCGFDAIYVCGGDTKYLLSEVNRTGFNEVLHQAVEAGLFYIGVSAGSLIASGSLPDNLGYIANELNVHQAAGSPCGALPGDGAVCLTDTQAIFIKADERKIVD